MKRDYMKPEVEVIYFETEDVITTSGDAGFEDGGDEED